MSRKPTWLKMSKNSSYVSLDNCEPSHVYVRLLSFPYIINAMFHGQTNMSSLFIESSRKHM